MQSFTLAIAAIVGVALANKPVAPAYAPAPVAQPYAAPVTVVQNAAVVEPTVT
ncbi:hypothetical protein GGI17_000504, partial [Coemansia sp. S146]